MTLKVYESAALDLMVACYPANATVTEGTEALRQYVADNPEGGALRIVIDCGGARTDDLDYRSVSNIAAQKAADFQHLTRCEKLVIIARNEMQFGFSRMYVSLIDERLNFDIITVQDETEALQYVGLEHADLASLITTIEAEPAQNNFPEEHHDDI